jgi:hypothetical protein
MDIARPSDDEIAAILSSAPYRNPQPARITVLGDRGAQVQLPFVLGAPTGACTLPPGAQASEVWAEFLAAMLRLKKADESAEDLAAVDVVLYPDPGTLAVWCDRWPALPALIWTAAKRQIGAMAEVLDEVKYDEKMLPPALVDVAQKHQDAAVRRLKLSMNKATSTYLVLVSPPQAAAWRFFLAELRKERADRWKLARELVLAQVRACVDLSTGKEEPLASIIARWPGAAVMLAIDVMQLAGMVADIDLGEL